MINKILHINKVIEQCKTKIQDNQPVLLILDIDDTILSTRPNQTLVEPAIRDLFDLVYQNNHLCKYIFCTARHSSYRKLTLNQLNHAKLLHLGTYINYVVLHSPYVRLSSSEPQPTKGNAILSYLRGANIDPITTHIIIVDDDDEQIHHINQFLEKSEYDGKYSLWHYIASWAQQHNCWIPALPSITKTAAP